MRDEYKLLVDQLTAETYHLKVRYIGLEEVGTSKLALRGLKSRILEIEDWLEENAMTVDTQTDKTIVNPVILERIRKSKELRQRQEAARAKREWIIESKKPVTHNPFNALANMEIEVSK